jgi:hypothetical protein
MKKICVINNIVTLILWRELSSNHHGIDDDTVLVLKTVEKSHYNMRGDWKGENKSVPLVHVAIISELSIPTI